ncbi:hypothetical protein DPMN_046718 [Dreissena polymorpha]|uniref:Uncharacterized protein n=1 Tax=Dreissena polymorpha TaxID=45954 RepID=A0A9D4D6Q2_DREPO|nr:hypothetical protein DPMN_046718 [Dreissena polymorpha]
MVKKKQRIPLFIKHINGFHVHNIRRIVSFQSDHLTATPIGIPGDDQQPSTSAMHDGDDLLAVGWVGSHSI